MNNDSKFEAYKEMLIKTSDSFEKGEGFNSRYLGATNKKGDKTNGEYVIEGQEIIWTYTDKNGKDYTSSEQPELRLTFADGGNIYSDMTEKEFLTKYFGANTFVGNPSEYFDIKNLSSGNDLKVEAFITDLKKEGYSIKKKSYSDFTSVMGVKKKNKMATGGAVSTETIDLKFYNEKNILINEIDEWLNLTENKKCISVSSKTGKNVNSLKELIKNEIENQKPLSFNWEYSLFNGFFSGNNRDVLKASKLDINKSINEVVRFIEKTFSNSLINDISEARNLQEQLLSEKNKNALDRVDIYIVTDSIIEQDNLDTTVYIKNFDLTCRVYYWDIKKWNDIRNENLKPGMKLKING